MLHLESAKVTRLILPFVRREAGHDTHGGGDENVGGQHVQPNVDVEWTHEGEQSGRDGGRKLEQNADAQIHEGFREIDHRLAHIIDRHRGHRQIGILEGKTNAKQ